MRAPSGLAYLLAARRGPRAAGERVRARAALARAGADGARRRDRGRRAGRGRAAADRARQRRSPGGRPLRARRPRSPVRHERRRAHGPAPSRRAAAARRRARRRPLPARRRRAPDRSRRLRRRRSASCSPSRFAPAGSRCVNRLGSGIADDKAIHVYVEAMIGFYLGEEPLLPVGARASTSASPVSSSERWRGSSELVVKPRSGFGGRGVTIGPLAAAARAAGRRRRRAADPGAVRRPGGGAALDPPDRHGGRRRRRHVDLRPFVITAGESVTVVARRAHPVRPRRRAR